MKKVEVSIIIVNFNTKKLIKECLESIFASKTKATFEIIVVDNNSTDGSRDYLKSQNSKSKNLEIILNNDNMGFAKANNLGIKMARGKYILLLNSDTQVKAGAVDKMLTFAKETKDAGVVAPKLLNSDGSIQESVFPFPTIGKTIRQYWLGEKNLLDKYAPKADDPITVDVVVAAAFLITPLALEKVGLLNEKYFMYFEDLDYCKRVWNAGLKVYYYPGAEVIHYHGASGKKVVDDANQWKRLIPSAKIYYGTIGYYLRWFITRTGQLVNK
jgi:GT2 family glycosyltransferase